MSVSFWQWACISQTDFLSDVRSLAALDSCNCICFWSRRGKSKRKELTLLFQVIGSQSNRLGACPELFKGTQPTQGLVLSCSLSAMISIKVPNHFKLPVWISYKKRSSPSFNTLKYHEILLQNLQPGGKWWKKRFFFTAKWSETHWLLWYVMFFSALNLLQMHD